MQVKMPGTAAKSVSMLTLGVKDVQRSVAFYEAMGWEYSPDSDGACTYVLSSNIAIGLLPEVELGKITVTGNAALMGAAMLLLDKEKLPEAERLAAAAQTVDLASDAFFKECYMEGMLF